MHYSRCPPCPSGANGYCVFLFPVRERNQVLRSPLGKCLSLGPSLVPAVWGKRRSAGNEARDWGPRHLPSPSGGVLRSHAPILASDLRSRCFYNFSSDNT
jgi:hypothetical protein